MKLGTQRKLTFNETIAEVLGLDTSDQREAQRRFFQHRLGVEDRTEVFRRVFLDGNSGATRDFIVMLVFSSCLATIGLSQNSVATIIGSMVIAPLGNPIIALGGAIAVVWHREAAKMLLMVFTGLVIVIGVSYLTGLMLLNSTPTAQILARTDPDLRDLGVAMLAGAAGAYVKTSVKLSSSIIGVAIAIALVPPLATVGLMLEEGRFVLAAGALTLFTANLAGMVLAVATTLLVTGYVPLPKLRQAPVKFILGFCTTIVATVLVAIPLAVTYNKIDQAAHINTIVNDQVAETLDINDSSAIVEDISVKGNNVVIDLSDTENAPSVEEFEADLINEVGPDVEVEIE